MAAVNLPGKKTIRPSVLGTTSTDVDTGLEGAAPCSTRRSPSSSLSASSMAKKFSVCTRLPAAPIKAWFEGLRLAYCSRKGSASLRYVEEDSGLFPYFLLM